MHLFASTNSESSLPNHSSFSWICLSFAILLFASTVSKAYLRLYVSPNGNDSWSGKYPTPAKNGLNGPFATLTAARNTIRNLETKGKFPKGGVRVIIMPGTYPLNETFQLTQEDSGTQRSPIVYEAAPKTQVILSGGREIHGFQPVTDPNVLKRFQPEARNHILQVDLKSQGITDYGEMTSQGFGRNVEPLPLELFFNEKPMQLARWPKTGWLRIQSVPNGPNGGEFTYSGDEPQQWNPNQNLWVYGYWNFDWADSYEKVKRLDANNHTVYTVDPSGPFGYTVGRRFYFLNVMEEVSQPGDYYLDKSSGILYFYPPSPIETGQAVVSMLSTPLISLQNCSWVTIKGITCSYDRGDGASIQNGERNLFKDCEFQDIGDRAIQINGGDYNGADHCSIHDVGEGGIVLNGGDRTTLTPANNFVTNCDIWDVNRWARTYHPCVAINGDGNIVAHNILHDAPHAAILLSGNDHLIEYNDIYKVCTDTADAGAIYMGRDWSMQGNVIRYNYIHDLARQENGEGYNHVMGVYLDDTFSGVKVYGNIFDKADIAVLMGGGSYNRIDNNIFIDCSTAISVDARGMGWAKKSVVPGGDWHMYSKLRALHYDQPPYSTHYPNLVKMMAGNPAMPMGDQIMHNICYGGNWLSLGDNLKPDQVGVADNYVGNAPGFVDYSKGVFRLRKDSPAWRLGFKAIPMDRIGPEKENSN